MKRITPSVVLLVGILSLFSPVTPAPAPAPGPPTGSGIPGLPREFQNVNVENYLRVSENKFLKKIIPMRGELVTCNDWIFNVGFSVFCKRVTTKEDA